MAANEIYFHQEELKSLSDCNICPHECRIDRFISNRGICRTSSGLFVASVSRHMGEEPVISGKHGICNVFFSHCNLQCIFCQNHQISSNIIDNQLYEIGFQDLIEKIRLLLQQGCQSVGFVSPSHMIPHIKMIIRTLRELGESCTFVYNSNAYDKVETLQSLEGMIDVYLPDFKYWDEELSREYSGAGNYPEIAAKAIKEMYRQKGSTLITDTDERAVSGLIIRHLVLPGHSKNSKEILNFIATEISTNIHVSLMSQYYPVYRAIGHEKIGRKLTAAEYQEVVDEMEKLGLHKGWVQALDSPEHYLPDFNNKTPFGL